MAECHRKRFGTEDIARRCAWAAGNRSGGEYIHYLCECGWWHIQKEND